MEPRMTRAKKLAKCTDFMNCVAYLLKDSYEMLPSCNHDISQYLIPIGTKNELSYYEKPDRSLRFSDHWNWFASKKRCSDLTLVQCRSLDIPWVRKREEPEAATKPRYGIQVCIYDAKTKCYHHVYGDKFDRHTRKWTWIEADPVNLATKMKEERTNETIRVV